LKEINLPSGAKLGITLAPFSDSKALYTALIQELKTIHIGELTKLNINLMKDLICAAMSSENVEKCIWKCMERAVYNKLNITQDTFEPEEARQDYNIVLMEVGKANVLPFLKSLSPQYAEILSVLKSDQG
jgi:hypothetical protein